jgi:hypothetical protein
VIPVRAGFYRQGGRLYKIVAQFPQTPIGRKRANDAFDVRIHRVTYAHGWIFLGLWSDEGV